MRITDVLVSHLLTLSCRLALGPLGKLTGLEQQPTAQWRLRRSPGLPPSGGPMQVACGTGVREGAGLRSVR